jgi:hypothetical protein
MRAEGQDAVPTSSGRLALPLAHLRFESSSAIALLPEEANSSQPIKRMVLRIRRFFLMLALGGSRQMGRTQLCKSLVGGSIPLACSTEQYIVAEVPQ